MNPVSSSRPFHVMVKPIGPICNLDCSYCFYLDKEDLYPENPSWRMSEEVLEKYIRQMMEGQPTDLREINFAWQGGEPTLMGLPFFEKAVELQRRHAPEGVKISNAFQTNATLIDEQWAEFFRREGFLLGVSIDGPPELHDAYRKDKGGRDSLGRTMRGLEHLKAAGVEFNTLTVVNDRNSERPGEVYRFLKQQGSTFMQFIPLVEHGESFGELTERTVPAEKWGSFLNGIFDEWVKRDIGRIYVQHFEMMLHMCLTGLSTLCVHGRHCGRAAALEHNGDLYSCDHYVFPEYRLGNLKETTMQAMMDSPPQEKFGRDKYDTLPDMCRSCDYLRYCYGGCPAHRTARTPSGQEGLNHLCAGYFAIYEHTLPTFEAMARALRANRPAIEYPRFLREANARVAPVGNPSATAVRNAKPTPTPAPTRNAPCPCGSGGKFKHCHGKA